MDTTQAAETEVKTETGGSVELTQDKLAEVISAVVFESGILSKLVERQLEQKLSETATKTVQNYVRNEMPKAVSSQVSRAVTEALNSDQVKELIDGKFRAIMLYMKSDVIPKAVKDTLARGNG